MASKLSSFLAELKRRKVLRAIVGYAVGGVALIEGVGLVQPTLHLSNNVYDFVVLLVLLGFPIALILSWFVDITADGLRRTPAATPEQLAVHSPVRWAPRGWVLVGVGTLVVVASGYFAFFRIGNPGGEADRVAVFPFQNLTGHPELDVLSDVVVHSLTSGLSRMEAIRTVPAKQVLDARPKDSQEISDDELAETLGADLLVTGMFTESGEELLFQAEVTRVATGETLPVAEARGPTDQERVTEGVAALLDAVRGALALSDDPALSYYIQDPPSYQAYLTFFRGEQSFLEGDMEAAARHYLDAYASDSTFLFALISAGTPFLNLGEYARVDSIVSFVEGRRDELSGKDQYWLDWLGANARGDLVGALEVLRFLVAWDPDDDFSRANLGHAALHAGRVEEALEAYEKTNPDHPAIGNHPAYWENRARAALYLARFQKALTVARRGKELNPEYGGLRRREIQALLGLQQLDETDLLVDSLETMSPRGGSNPGIVLMNLSGDLAWAGHVGEARWLAWRAVDWFRAHDPEGSLPAKARGLLLADRFEEAAELLRPLVAENPDYLGLRRRYGIALALAGDRDGAAAEAEWCAGVDRPFLQGMDSFCQAAILAHLGEREEAVRLLRQAHQQGLSYLTLHSNPDLKPLWEYEPYRELISPKN